MFYKSKVVGDLMNTIIVKAGTFEFNQRLNLNWEAMRKSYNTFFELIIRGLFFCTILGNQAFAQALNEDPNALLLYNFGKYSGSNCEGDQFTFVIFGDAAIANNLKQISKNKKINGKPVNVKECSALDQIDTPQILFVSASKSGMLQEILDRTKGKPVKVIMEKSGQAFGEKIDPKPVQI